MSIDNTLAQAQTRLYELADRLPAAADRIEAMAIHSMVGDAVYTAMPKTRDGIGLEDAARLMLAALKERAAWSSTAPSLRGSGWDAYGAKITAMENAAIAAADAAGIGEE